MRCPFVRESVRAAVEAILRDEAGVAPGDRIVVGVSGGGDSVALLHLLREIGRSFPFTLHAAHFDHALRAESAADARFVDELCRAWEVPLVSRRVDVLEASRRLGLGIEEGGRHVRRAFFEETASALGCRWIALGHHRGDQAETLLHRIVRGTGVAGMAAMALRSGPYLRPLLGFGRGDILAYLRSHDLAWREDGSNDDPRFTRNRLRSAVLPLLAQFNPRIEEHLGRLSGRIALEEDFWRSETARSLEALRCRGASCLALDRAKLVGLHPALRLRVLREAILEARGSLMGIGAAHIESIEGLALSTKPQSEVHLPDLLVRRRYDKLLFSRDLSPSRPFSLPLSLPGECRLPDGRLLRAEIVPCAGAESLTQVEFDAEAVPFPLTVRSFLAGDRFYPCGAAGSKKLKDFFIDRKIDAESRRSLPLVVANEILWVAGVRRCHGRRPVAGRPVLRLTLTPP